VHRLSRTAAGAGLSLGLTLLAPAFLVGSASAAPPTPTSMPGMTMAPGETMTMAPGETMTMAPGETMTMAPDLGAAAGSHPRGLVLGGFALVNAALLAVAAGLRRRPVTGGRLAP